MVVVVVRIIGIIMVLGMSFKQSHLRFLDIVINCFFVKLIDGPTLYTNTICM